MLQKNEHQVQDSPLGKETKYDPDYNPDLLYPIARANKRREIGIDIDHLDDLPFFGWDSWNHYEVSWLNEKGKPLVAIAEIYYDCTSPFIVESKSLKLYFNSLNNAIFKSINEIESLIKKDLEKIIGAKVFVIIKKLKESSSQIRECFQGECIDDLDIDCTQYTVNPDYLTTSDEWVEETLHSDLLKSNCLITQQPDWGSVQIIYKGNKINREGLLRYLISYRHHNEFHEQCVERVFVHIMQHCQPQELTVYGRFTRRGGLDINPYRSTKNISFKEFTQLIYRLIRQ